MATKREKIDQEIVKRIREHGSITTSFLVDKFSVSRTYAHACLCSLENAGVVRRVGSTNRSRYIFPEDGLSKQTTWVKTFQNKKIMMDESAILQMIRDETTLFAGLRGAVKSIFEYAFTEIVNNAREHSRANKIVISVERREGKDSHVFFRIKDNGIGIFTHIQKTIHLGSEEEAIEWLLKGKCTTASAGHSGEGIFFTSKIADTFSIRSGDVELRFDNTIPDAFVGEKRSIKGTDVEFSINTATNKDLIELFTQYCTDSDEMSAFDTTLIHVKVYQLGGTCISRSQAKRLTSGLEKFKRIVLDFTDVSLIGQGFADEVFRVWQNQYKDTEFTVQNANSKVQFMIRRAQAQ